ncbi:MAG TPA: pilus assembly protein TadG-related protein [Candidatus Binataceae bacterium]|nr:pilus assembly protein TadG-related protein [Candidatus Binataceae bacterium]
MNGPRFNSAHGTGPFTDVLSRATLAPYQRTHQRVARRNSGQVIVALTVAIVVIMIGAGLAADIGYMQRQRQRMQVAADAAAIAGASAIVTGASTPAAAGANDAALNGFTTGSGATVTINNPPQSGIYTSNSSFVEAIIDQPQPTWFLSLLGIRTIDVNARAVAGASNSNGCLYVLNPAKSGAITVNGTGSITSQCGVLDDSSSSTALVANGNVNVNASSIGVVGQVQTNGSATLSPNPVVGIVPVSDPLASVPAPFVGSCTYNNYSVGSGQSVEMSPGVYCGGITIGGNAQVTFAAGVYVLRGGGMIVSSGATLSGSGVTFYDTTGSAGYSPISISGSVTANLSAPTSGMLKGILFFQDRTVTNGAGSVISGGVNADLSGVLYFPTTNLTYNGGSANSYSIIVANTLTVNGNVTMNANYSALQGGSPIQSATLAE